MKEKNKLRKEHVIGTEKAYINTSEPLTARTQCWRMMDIKRMIEIFDESLAAHKLTTQERFIITEVKMMLYANR